MKKILISLVIFCFILMCVLPSFAISDDEKSQITNNINKHVERLKSYTPQVEQNYFKQYTDITTSAYRGFIGRLIHTGITTGTSKTTFSPKTQINGGQFVTLLLRAMGYNLQAPSGQPYYVPYISKARELGLLEPKEMINPLRVITQKEVARIMVKAVELLEPIQMNSYYGEVFYKYEGTWGEAFKPYIKKIHASGIMGLDLKSGIFEANKPLTREEMSMVIVKFVEKTRRTPYDRDKKDVFIIRGQYSHWEDNKIMSTIPDLYKQSYSASSLKEFYDKYSGATKSDRFSACFFEPNNKDFSRMVRAFLEYEKVCKSAFAVMAWVDGSGDMINHYIRVFADSEPNRDFMFYTRKNNRGANDIRIELPPYAEFLRVQSDWGVERHKKLFPVIKDIYKILLEEGNHLNTVYGWYENTIFKCSEYGGVGEPFLGFVDTVLNGRRVEGHHGGGGQYIFRIYYKK
ncbi:MAG: S-layer homology domain-containing protein [Thermoplasmata archaeon]